MDDIETRLCAVQPFVNDPITLKPRLTNPDGPEAAEEMRRLRAEIRRLQQKRAISYGRELDADEAQFQMVTQILKNPALVGFFILGTAAISGWLGYGLVLLFG